jgi:Family of unknown function (DUF6612)
MKPHLRSKTIICIAACVLLLLACRLTQGISSPTLIPQPLTPEQIIERSKQAAKETPMHMVMDMTISMSVLNQEVGMTANMSLDANSPEEMQMNMALDMMGQSFTTEMIIVHGKVYTKDPMSGEWTISPQSPTVARKAAEALDLNSLKDVTLVDEEVVDGIPAYHFKAKISFPATFTETLGSVVEPMDVDYYVAKDTYLPIKMLGSGNLKIDVSNLETEMAFSMEAVFSNWGQETEITAPIP